MFNPFGLDTQMLESREGLELCLEFSEGVAEAVVAPEVIHGVSLVVGDRVWIVDDVVVAVVVVVDAGATRPSIIRSVDSCSSSGTISDSHVMVPGWTPHVVWVG